MTASLWFGLVVIMLMLLVIFVELQRIREAIKDQTRTIAHIDATRQARIKGTVATRRNPQVDADVKVKQRYPAEYRGARMGMAVERKKTHGRRADDA